MANGLLFVLEVLLVLELCENKLRASFMLTVSMLLCCSVTISSFSQLINEIEIKSILKIIR